MQKENNKKTKVILVFGGVYSSLGKGVAVSSIAKILKNLGNEISMLKFDPYLNVDPGNMAPGQHGEVYVTKDGAQTDLDLGNYERYIEKELTQASNVTSGRIYNEIIKREREGNYGGKTVQIIPHVTNAIKDKIYHLINTESPNFLVIEIGGTVGDMESAPFIEALSQFIIEYGEQNVLTILLSPLISLNSTSGEVKTKPTQHSVKELRSLGITPNLLILRTGFPVEKSTIVKLSLNCHIPENKIFISSDAKIVYEVPVKFYEQNIHLSIYDYFGLKYDSSKNTFSNWISYINDIKKIENKTKIALVGKYTDLHDAYCSLIEAIKLAGYVIHTNVEIKWIEAEQITKENISELVKDCGGILVPGGFGERGIDQMLIAIKYARESDIPFLGICLGMQLTCIEAARNLLGWENANSTEFNLDTKKRVIDLIDGSFRLGNQTCTIKPKSIAHKLYNSQTIEQRHRHRYALFHNDIIESLETVGIKSTMFGSYHEKQVVEFVENDKLRCFIACQYHPEFHCKPNNVDPIFTYFIEKSAKFFNEKNK